ncbi:hypothetical protein CQ13_36165 [Bradyrhizobium retamae]|uniref:Uncharacterized protein n=1 Tax=Bradyrhizobium retamae TaxID=1300035 RepID=A0A0R3MCJ9_9BRAD|nr:hypothetical protein CQ13_36165 [Bradyrhizobium retamae]
MVTLIEDAGKEAGAGFELGASVRRARQREQRRGEGDAFHLSSVPWGVEVDPAADLKAARSKDGHIGAWRFAIIAPTSISFAAGSRCASSMIPPRRLRSDRYILKTP